MRYRVLDGTRRRVSRGGRVMSIAQATSTVSLRTARATALRSTRRVPVSAAFRMAALDGGGTSLQQRWVETDGSGGNWIGYVGFAQIIWDLDGGTCNFNDWSTSTEVTYEQALACDALLNHQGGPSMAAACGRGG